MAVEGLQNAVSQCAAFTFLFRSMKACAASILVCIITSPADVWAVVHQNTVLNAMYIFIFCSKHLQDFGPFICS